MKRFLLILLAFLLVACGAADSETATAPPDPTDTLVEAQPTDAPEPTALPAIEPTAVEGEVATDPTTVSDQSTAETAEEVTEATGSGEVVLLDDAAQTPAEASVTRGVDHFKGAAEPDVVLVEYGDFQ